MTDLDPTLENRIHVARVLWSTPSISAAFMVEICLWSYKTMCEMVINLLFFRAKCICFTCYSSRFLYRISFRFINLSAFRSSKLQSLSPEHQNGILLAVVCCGVVLHSLGVTYRCNKKTGDCKQRSIFTHPPKKKKTQKLFQIIIYSRDLSTH